MAYLNEFPHFESNKLNLDWLLEQYSTFNDRIAEIQQSFEDAVEQFENDLQSFETDVNTAISNFETNVNNIISEFQTSTNDEISEFESTVTNEINSLTTNMITYVSEHMDEWQAAATYNGNILRFSNPTSPLLNYSDSCDRVLVDSTIHDFRLAPPQYYIRNSQATSWAHETGQYTFPEELHTEGKGVYLIIAELVSSWNTNETSIEIGAGIESADTTKGDLLIPYTDVEVVNAYNNTAIKRTHYACIFKSNERVDIKFSSNCGDIATHNAGLLSGVVYKLSDDMYTS